MDYKFIENEISKKWVISSPRRAKRNKSEDSKTAVCPFCTGNENMDEETYRIGSKEDISGWKVRVISNKFPFAPIHEVVIHSPDHHKNFDELPLEQNLLVLQTFRQRFETYQDKGQVCIFHNHGKAAGESQPHPHSQIAVIPDFVKLEIPRLITADSKDGLETEHFVIYVPDSSEWPDEVWLRPRQVREYFSMTSDEELNDLARILYRLIQIFDLRHGHEFPFNFYISPHKDWYLRLIPRLKTVGGFELGTNVWVNTQDTRETMAFIKEHFESPDEEKIRRVHQAQYHRAV